MRLTVGVASRVDHFSKSSILDVLKRGTRVPRFKTVYLPDHKWVYIWTEKQTIASFRV